MAKITKEQYEFALARIEELLPMVDDNTPANDRNAVELTMMSDVVIDYEKEHYPIGKPTVAQLIQLSLDEKNMSQKQEIQSLGQKKLLETYQMLVMMLLKILTKEELSESVQRFVPEISLLVRLHQRVKQS